MARKKRKATKSAGLLHSAFEEVYSNTPKIVTHTAKKFGAARARKQRIAIAFSKARKAKGGGRIPKAKGY